LVVVVGMDNYGVVEVVLVVAVVEVVIRDLLLVVVHVLLCGEDADRVAIGEGWCRC